MKRRVLSAVLLCLALTATVGESSEFYELFYKLFAE